MVEGPGSHLSLQRIALKILFKSSLAFFSFYNPEEPRGCNTGISTAVLEIKLQFSGSFKREQDFNGYEKEKRMASAGYMLVPTGFKSY